VRPAATTDEATPNPNGIAAQNIVRLAGYCGVEAWRRQADRLFDGMLPIAAENLFMHVSLLNALDLRLRMAEIVVVGSGARAEALAATARKLRFLDRIVLRAPSAEALPRTHPAQDKIKATTEAAAFICVGERCSLPVTEAAQIAETIKAVRG
jgi:uncharacterized protein YyaL (SSP411 family)